MALTKIGTDSVEDQSVTLDKLPHGTVSNDGKFLRANNGADPSFETVSSVGGATGVDFNDTVRARFGTNFDLQIFHDGVQSYVYDSGTGDLNLQTNGTKIKLGKDNGATCGAFIPDGAVELYHNNSKKFETTSAGATVTGTLASTNIGLGDNGQLRLGASNDFTIAHNATDTYLTNNTGNFIIQSSNATGDTFHKAGRHHYFRTGGNKNGIDIIKDGAVSLYHNGSKDLETDGTGIRVDMQNWGSDPSSSNWGAALASPNSGGFVIAAAATTGSDCALFINPNGIVGRIHISGSGTSFNTSSDYRLKENVTAISDGITRLKTLKPSRFNFKADAKTTVDGFLAHEVTNAVPEAVTGEKDAVELEDNDKKGIKKGDIIPQGIDQSKLVPLLTAALQEAIAKIEVLETKVAALEAA